MSDPIEDRLTRYYARGSGEDAAGARVLTRLDALPPQKHAPWTHIPGILLDWQFAPAWPRMAALACCAALGFYVGIAGLDRRFEDPGAAPAFVGGGGIGSITFEPEAFTGARP